MHNCENNIESNMSPAHCRVCGKYFIQQWNKEPTGLNVEENTMEEWTKRVEESANDYNKRMYFGDGGLFEDKIANWWLEKLSQATQQARKELLEEIKGRIKDMIAEPTELKDVIIYNTALQDILSILENRS